MYIDHDEEPHLLPIHGESLVVLARGCPNLQELKFLCRDFKSNRREQAFGSRFDARAISDAHIEDFARALPKLQSLALEFAVSTVSHLTYRSLISFGTHCRHLEHLEFEAPYNIAGLARVTEPLFPVLRVFSFMMGGKPLSAQNHDLSEGDVEMGEAGGEEDRERNDQQDDDELDKPDLDEWYGTFARHFPQLEELRGAGHVSLPTADEYRLHYEFPFTKDKIERFLFPSMWWDIQGNDWVNEWDDVRVEKGKSTWGPIPMVSRSESPESESESELELEPEVLELLEQFRRISDQAYEEAMVRVRQWHESR